MPPGQMNAARLLRSRGPWITPIALAAPLIVLMALVYLGSVVDPVSHLRGLPVDVVNQDQHVTVGSEHLDFGQQLVAGLYKSPQVTRPLALHTTTLIQAQAAMDKGSVVAVISIPPGFTASLLDLYQPSSESGSRPRSGSVSGVPTIRLLTNQRTGSVGTTMATGVSEPAISAVMNSLIPQLSARRPVDAPTTAALTALRADPVSIDVVGYRPLPAHAALGLSAFYLSLLTLMVGFLGGTITHTSVDSWLGFAPTEIGPLWRLRRPVPISRWQTLLTKWALAVVLAPVLDGLMLIVGISILHVAAPNVLDLWLFTSFASIVVALGTLVLFACFGAIGQLLAMLGFVYLSLASSGGTVPIQALPPVLRYAANVEPLRQILDGVRSIVYFDAAPAAGLTRGLLMTGVGLVFWLVTGVVSTRFYDRRGLNRMSPRLLAFIHRAADDYRQGSAQPPPAPALTK